MTRHVRLGCRRQAPGSQGAEQLVQKVVHRLRTLTFYVSEIQFGFASHRVAGDGSRLK